MKKYAKVLSFLLAVLMLAVLSAAFASADDPAPTPTVYFSLDYYKTLEADALQEKFKLGDVQTMNVTWDSEHEMLLFDTTENTALREAQFNDLGPSIDLTEAHWMKGKTLEYEVVMVDIMNTSNNPLVEYGMYSCGTGDYANHVNANYGCNIWFYCRLGISSTNCYPVTMEHTQYQAPGPRNEEGSSVKFKIIENDYGVFHFYDDGDGWVLLNSYDAADLNYDRGAPFICLRNGDVYGLKSYTISATPASENIKFEKEAEQETEHVTGKIQESDPKYILSQESFRRAEDVSAFFPLISSVSGSIKMWQGGANKTAVSYDAAEDMVLINTKENTNIQGVLLDIPGVDPTEEHWFNGYTIEYELVLKELNSSMPMSQIGIYFDNFSHMDNGCAIWWYMKSGRLTEGNCKENFDHVYDLDLKKVQGDSVKFRITEDDFGIATYYNVGEGWEMLGFVDSEDLYFVKGNMWLAFRNGDVYGIKNFAMYVNEEEDPTPVITEPVTTEVTPSVTDPVTTAAPATTGTPAAESETPETVENKGKSGCASVLSAGALAAAAMVAFGCLCARKKED